MGFVRVCYWAILLMLLIASTNIEESNAQSQKNVYTSFSQYNPAGRDYRLDGLYCSRVIAGKPRSWLSKHKWIAFCASAGGPMHLSLCGKCLKVRNVSTGQSVVVRIVDRCNNRGLILDMDAFNAIDGNEEGYDAGYLRTVYSFVPC
eukprot:Gb_07802 [translate_table: standard]